MAFLDYVPERKAPVIIAVAWMVVVDILLYNADSMQMGSTLMFAGTPLVVGSLKVISESNVSYTTV